MTLTQRVLRGSSLNLIDHVVRIGAMLLVTPSMVSSLGLEKYGVWLILTAAVAFLNLLDAGITLSGTRFLARAIGQDDPLQTGKVIGTLASLYRWVGSACLMASALLGALVPWIIEDAAWQAASRWVLLALGSGMSLRFFLRIHLVVLKSHLRYDLIVAASLIKVVLQTTIILILLTRGCGLVELALAQIVSDLFDQVLVTMFSRRTQSESPATPQTCSKLRREILKYSSMAFLNTTGQHLRSRIDPFVITAFVGVSSVPVYNMGLRFVTLFADMMNAVMGGTLLAGFSHVEGRDGLNGVRRKFLFSLRFSVPMALLGAAGLAMLGPPFLIRWVGPEFKNSGTVLRLLILPYTLWLMQIPVGSLLLSLNQHRLITRMTFAAGIFNVLLSVALASWIGFYGVVWATFVDMTLFYGLAVPLMVSRVLKTPLADYYQHLFGIAVKLGVILGMAMVLVQPFCVSDYVSLLIAATILTLIFLTAAPGVLLTRVERQRFFKKLRCFLTKRPS